MKKWSLSVARSEPGRAIDTIHRKIRELSAEDCAAHYGDYLKAWSIADKPELSSSDVEWLLAHYGRIFDRAKLAFQSGTAAG